MVLADEHIAEFQALYKEHFGIELTKAQALEKGLRVIRLVENISRIIATDDNQQGSLINTDNKNN
jgi:hypothetical protein